MTKQKDGKKTESYWSNLWGGPKEYKNSGTATFRFVFQILNFTYWLSVFFFSFHVIVAKLKNTFFFVGVQKRKSKKEQKELRRRLEDGGSTQEGVPISLLHINFLMKSPIMKTDRYYLLSNAKCTHEQRKCKDFGH